jgi:hypothetical protein
MNVHGVEITDTEVADIEMMEALIPEEIAMLLDKIIADGGYYSKEVVEERWPPLFGQFSSRIKL